MRLNMLTWGAGGRRALLVHGLTSNAAGWWRLGPDIAGLGYTVAAPDLRGHGHSPRSIDYSLDAYADDVAELGSWDVVLGHSMGGSVALALARRLPGWTGQLVLEDPAVFLPDTTAAAGWILMDYNGEVTAESLALAHPGWGREDAVHKAEALQQSGPDVVRATFAANDPWDLRSGLEALQVPTLLIGADPAQGALVPPSFGASLAANPLVTFVTVKGSHSMHRDAYPEFWEVLRTVL